MTIANEEIQFDYAAGKFSGAGLSETIGLKLMQLAARATSPMNYKGASLLFKYLSKAFPSGRSVQAELYPGTHFQFPYGDAYWSTIFDNSEVYCPDLEPFLISLKDEEYAFIDCGANYGYMSALVSSEAFGNQPAIAIEAHPDTFKHLQSNADLSQNKFEVLNNAVFSKSGDLVCMDGAKHEARSIIQEDGSIQSGTVETIALDDLLPWAHDTGLKKIILKLDVEGVEIEALKGATDLLQEHVLIAYECHGSDKTHEVSSYIMNELGMRVFEGRKDDVREMKDLEMIDETKAFSHWGYDFLATKSPVWLEILENRTTS